MPSSPSPARSTSKSSVLLIEEYGAIAAALKSALKKFAPGHPVNVARALAEAETLAKEKTPELIIIDFDPSYPGLTEFLHRHRDVCPDAKVLIIGAGISKELASQYRSLGAFQFIQKPFEVEDFGASVQALLGPWQEAGSAQPRGTLRAMTAADAVLLQCAGNRTVVLDIKSASTKSGQVHVVEGRLVHAFTNTRNDGEALEEMFGWSEPQIKEVETRSTAGNTIRESWPAIFLTAARTAMALRPVAAMPPAPPTPPLPREKTGKKIVVIDDTEMLLIFVEDTLATADPELQITTAANGTSGVKQVERTLPDLVLLDYSLPDINGDEVCRQLLKNEITARIPILMMSGHIPEMTATAAKFDNVVATLSKPFRSEALTTLVQKTLRAGPRPVPKPRPVVKEIPAPRKAIPKAPPVTPKIPEPIAARKEPEKAKTPPPPLKIEHVAPPPVSIPKLAEAPNRGTMSAPFVSKESNEVVLGLFLEVVSMQLTPSLRMGAIRARVSSPTVSLHVSPAALRATISVETGFQLGAVQLDAVGKIATLRLIPTLQPFQRLQTRNAVQIGALDVVPHDSREHVRLTPMANATMTMHLLAHLELAGVELSGNFQVSQLVLKSTTNVVRVTLNSEAVGQEQTGVFCETAAVRLDNAARLAELSLKPLK